MEKEENVRAICPDGQVRAFEPHAPGGLRGRVRYHGKAVTGRIRRMPLESQGTCWRFVPGGRNAGIIPNEDEALPSEVFCPDGVVRRIRLNPGSATRGRVVVRGKTVAGHIEEATVPTDRPVFVPEGKNAGLFKKEA